MCFLRLLPTTLLTPDLCPTISKPHTTRENLGEVGGDRPLGIVGSTVFSSAGEALKRVKNRGRNAKQIGGSLCFRDAKNRFRTGNLNCATPEHGGLGGGTPPRTKMAGGRFRPPLSDHATPTIATPTTIYSMSWLQKFLSRVWLANHRVASSA